MPTKAEQWLAAHARPPTEIELGLSRVRAVARRLGLPARTPTLTVAGTNGKGSVCALLEAILCAAGWRVGCHMSPHVFHFGERIRLNAAPADDDSILAAFAAVDAARGAAQLTYFELTTLAAARLFADRGCDIVVLEVGMGGRLDAVNIFPPTVSVITNIAIDHAEYLGDTRDAIGKEKAGICRRGRAVIIGDRSPPLGLLTEARRRRAKRRIIGEHFAAEQDGRCWRYRGMRRDLASLPLPALTGKHQLDNAACALAALECLPADYWPGAGATRAGLHAATLPGRTQVLPGLPVTILDVAHNPAAAAALERFLFASGYFPKTRAVFGMLARKDVGAFVSTLSRRVDEWLVAQPHGGDMSAQDLAAAVAAAGQQARAFPSVAAAAAAARAESEKNDRILVTGSFLTVSDFLSDGEYQSGG